MSVSIAPGAWRLGNFLFQIAAAASLAKDNGVYFEEPNFGYEKYFKRNYIQKGMPLKSIFTVNEPANFAFVPLSYFGPTQINGYFQSEKYFKHNADYIRDIFQRQNVSPSTFFLENKGSYNVAIHVRRGDYQKHPDFHPMLGLDYYTEAIKRLNSIDAKFFVFSDDIEWCKQNFHESFYFVEGQSDIEDFHTMTQCDSFIIGNSSFSWWAAWLGENDNKVVVAPNAEKRWFGPALKHYDMNDLLPEEWTQI